MSTIGTCSKQYKQQQPNLATNTNNTTTQQQHARATRNKKNNTTLATIERWNVQQQHINSSFWVQDELKGQPVETEPIPKNKGALVKQVAKEEMKKELGLTEIFV